MVPGVVQQLGGEAVVPAAAAGVVVDVVLLLARLYRPPRPGQHYCQYPAAVSTSSTTSAVIGDFQLTSTSNPFLCAADFFLQLGSCKEAVR